MSGLVAAFEALGAWLSPLVARVSPLLVPVFGPGELELAWPQALLLLPLPILVWLLLPPYRESVESVRIPFFERMAEASGQAPRRGAAVLRRSRLQWAVAPLVWLLALVALARPEWLEPPLENTESARDLLLAVDLSQSMEARDFRDGEGRSVDRLEAAKLVLDDFISRREGDRIGLVVFGEAAYLQAPFTRDLAVCRRLLDESGIGMAGPRTVIGDAIGLGIRLFEASPAKQKVLILLTDGNDTGSKVPPLEAARLAKGRGLTVHAVGIGDPETEGEDRLDFGTLEGIAGATGGRAYLAQDRERLAGIYRELDRLEPLELESLSYRPRRSIVHWPLGGSVALVLGVQLLLTLRLALAAMTGRREAARA